MSKRFYTVIDASIEDIDFDGPQRDLRPQA